MLSSARGQSHGMLFGRRDQTGFINDGLEEGEAGFCVFECKGLAQASHQTFLDPNKVAKVFHLLLCLLLLLIFT